MRRKCICCLCYCIFHGRSPLSFISSVSYSLLFNRLRVDTVLRTSASDDYFLFLRRGRASGCQRVPAGVILFPLFKPVTKFIYIIQYIIFKKYCLCLNNIFSLLRTIKFKIFTMVSNCNEFIPHKMKL